MCSLNITYSFILSSNKSYKCTKIKQKIGFNNYQGGLREFGFVLWTHPKNPL